MLGLGGLRLPVWFFDRWNLAALMGTLMVAAIFLKGALPGEGYPWLGVVSVVGFYIALGAMVGRMGLGVVELGRRWQQASWRAERVLSLAVALALFVIGVHLAAAGLMFGWTLLKAPWGPLG